MVKTFTENEINKDIEALKENKASLVEQVSQYEKAIIAKSSEVENLEKQIKKLKKQEELVKKEIEDQALHIIPKETMDTLFKAKENLDIELNALQKEFDKKTIEVSDKDKKINDAQINYDNKLAELKKEHDVQMEEWKAAVKAIKNEIKLLKEQQEFFTIETNSANAELKNAQLLIQKENEKMQGIENLNNKESGILIEIGKKQQELFGLEDRIKKNQESVDKFQLDVNLKQDELNEREGAISFRELLLEEKKKLLQNFVEFLMKKYEDPSLMVHYNKFISSEPKQIQ